MEHDPPDRLRAIHNELDRVETKDFWEIIDRGRNFEYMPDEQKAAMRRFFGWFDGPESTAMPLKPDVPNERVERTTLNPNEKPPSSKQVPSPAGNEVESPAPPPEIKQDAKLSPEA